MPKLLVIDDDTISLENMKFVLELENFDVLTATSGDSGLNIFNEYKDCISVVIADMKVSYLSGMNILKKVKEISPTTSVIMLTGYADIESAIHSMKQGAFDCLKKPLATSDLLITIHSAINNKKLLEDNIVMQKQIIEHKNYLQNLHDSAQKMLLSMLPRNIPKFPGFNFFIKFESSDVVGGDMYNVTDIGEYICFYVYDVASHGILAAVLSIMLKSFLENIEYNYKKGINKRRFPEIVYDLNQELNSHAEEGIFSTLFIGFIDKLTKTFYYVSAGHVPQYIMSEKNIISLPSTGTLLGAFKEATYSCNVFQLNKGDKIILFTDGIIEASCNEEIYGFKRLESILEKYKNESVENLVEKIFESSVGFSGNTFLDDVTIVGVEVSD